MLHLFRYVILIALTILLPNPLFSHEINCIKDILSHINKDQCVLVVFDIDNTLLHPVTDLGSDQWFSYLVQEQLQQGHDLTTAINHVVPLYIQVQHVITLIPTEDSLANDIALIQQQCDFAVCLTARSMPLTDKTLEELTRNNLCFHNPAHTNCLLDMPHPCVYKHGVIFCGLNDKGAALVAFLDHIQYHPDLIIFIDDKVKYINSVQNALKTKNIACVGLRYSGCDHRVHAFDPVRTAQELEGFLRLSDSFYLKNGIDLNHKSK